MRIPAIRARLAALGALPLHRQRVLRDSARQEVDGGCGQLRARAGRTISLRRAAG